MIFTLFATFIFAKTKICICNDECSSLCPSLKYLSRPNEVLSNFINSNLENEKELELDFYSNTKDHTFDIDLSQLNGIKVQFNSLSDSKSINIALKKEKSLIRKIKLEPNQQITLPQFDIKQADATISKLKIKNIPDQSILTNPDGLINVTCDQLQYTGNWGHGFVGSADHGSYSMTPGSKAYLKFYGTKVHVFAHMEGGSCHANIFIDSKLYERVNFNSNPSKHSVVFSSGELPFGEHLIEVVHDGVKDQSIVIVSFIYDPLPKYDRQKLGFDKLEQANNQWKQSDTNPLIFSANEKGAVGTFKFLGTRFWLTGVRDGSHGKFTVTIDDKTVDVNVLITDTSIAGYLHDHYPALLYQSDVLDFKEHTVTITVNDNEVSLVNFLCTMQPLNGVYVHYNEMKKEGSWREDDGGYLSREMGSSLSLFGFFNHFWIIGDNDISQAYMNVYFNDVQNGAIDTSKIRSSISDKVLLTESKVPDFGTYNFKIENNGDNQGPNTLKYLHISCLYYINDQKLSVDEEHETFNIADMERDSSWSEQAKSDSYKNLYSETKDSKVTVKFSGDKFWIIGSVGPNYGNVDIILDDEKFSTVSLYREREEDNVVYYTSPSIDFAYHTLTLSNPSMKGINVHQIHYQQYPDDQSMLMNLDGIINVTCDKLEYSGNWDKCVTGANANHGSYTSQIGAKAWYTFNGSKVHVFANREQVSPRMIIRIDGTVVARSNLRVPYNRAEIVYSSGDLPFGEHTIEIEHNGVEDPEPNKEYFITLSAFLVDPRPKFGGFKLGYKDATAHTGDWIENSTGTPTFSSSSDGASITFEFHGTRFWVTGERGEEIGRAEIIVDDKETYEVDVSVTEGGPYKNAANGNKAVLFHQSKVYELKDHKVTIKKKEQNISLVNLIYSNQPYNSICVPYTEMNNDGKWTEEQNGYISKEKGSSLIATEYFNHLWIIGSNELNKASMNIYYDDQKKGTVDTSQKKTKYSAEVLLYESKSNPINTYEVKIENNGDNTESTNEFPLHIGYFYYLTDKVTNVEQEHKTLNVEDIKSQDNSWTEQTKDGVTNLYTDKKGSKISVTITCSKFWISGSFGPNNGYVDIILDDETLSRVSLYQEKVEHNIIYYESPESVEFGYHTLTLYNPASKEINVHQIHYYQSPDDQSIIGNLDGLVNITCDKFAYNGDWAKCVDNINANWGSYTMTKGDSSSYTFNGTKVYVYANREPGACNAIIKLDGKIAAYVDLFAPSKDTEIVFSSNYLPFGEHTIEVINDGPNEKALVLASLFVDPTPKQGGFKLGFKDVPDADKKGSWAEEISGTPVFSSSDDDASITFRFHGTRFWLTGVRGTNEGKNIGKFDITIDNEQPITVDEIVKSGGGKAFADGNKAVLLYQSKVYDLKDHTVKITKNGHTISLVNFFYCNQPYNGMSVPYNELSKQGKWTEEQNGYMSQEKGSSLSLTEYFNHLWIVGSNKLNEASMNIYYNGEKKETVDTSQKKTQYSTEVLLYESKDLSLSTYEFKLENNNDKKHLHISNLYYSNDNVITIKEEYETIKIADMNHDGSWTQETKGNNIVNLYTKKINSKVTVKFSGDKFWIAGSVGPNYGNVDIILDDKKFSTASLYREREEDNVIYYESPSIEFKYHTLTLSNPTRKGVNVHQVHYQQTPDDQTMIENLDGLINITCDKFEYSGNWDKCITGANADHGSYVFEKGAKAWYTFNGTKVHVFAIREKNSPRMIIRIDDKIVARSNLNVATNRAEIIFSSSDLPFGEHKIEIENDGLEVDTGGNKPLTLCAFLVDPRPKFGGFKLGYKDATAQTGDWVENSAGTPTFSSSSKGASITFEFHGTRFWVTGERGEEIGRAEIIVDDKETYEVDVSVTEGGPYKNAANGNKAVLFHQSKVYELKDHKVTIKKKEQDISLVNFFYSNQPYNSICVPYTELNKQGTWTEEQNGYSSENKGSSLIVTKFFNHLWIFGNNGLNEASMNVYLNNEKGKTVDTSKQKTEHSTEVLLYESKDFPVGLYEVKIENNGDNTESTNELHLHVSYLYYLNDDVIEIDQNSIKIDSTTMTNRTGVWTDESLPDKVNNLWSEEQYSSVTVEFTGGKFWLIGSVGPSYGHVDILVDDQKIASISLYNEKPSTNVVYFESPPITFTEHRLTLLNAEKKPISIYSLFYDPVTPTFEFTPSKPFTSSEQFSASSQFSPSMKFSPTMKFSPSFSFDPMDREPSCSVSDTGSNYTLHGKRCNFQSTDGSTSVVQIARSNFTDITYNEDGGAIHIVNSGFECTTVEFKNCSSEAGGGGAIYIKNSKQQEKNITFSGLQFTNCHAVYGGAVFVYSNSDSNSVTIESCIFSSNTAAKSNPDKRNLFGGAALFLSAVNALVFDCRFNKNSPGGAVKIVDVSNLNDNSRFLFIKNDNLDENKNSILFTNCKFDIDEDSKSSIDIENVYKIKINLVDCHFAGKLEHGSHYIVGKVPPNYMKNFQIRSCKFEDERGLAVHFDVVEESMLQKSVKTNWPVIVGLVASVTAAVIYSILMLIKSRFTISENDQILDNEN